jgi:hypothetical protein
MWHAPSGRAPRNGYNELSPRPPKLPDNTQDAAATRILTDLADEQAWAAQFEATSAEQWNRLAEIARQDIAAGNTTPLAKAFQPR